MPRTTRVSWRAVAKRFTHIDAQFVEAQCLLGKPGSKYVVRFYAWWEHPSYLAARDAGEPWGFGDYDAHIEDVVVHPIDLLAFRASDRGTVTDWQFVEEHPLLWDYEEEAVLMCNRGFDAEELIERVTAWRIPYVTRDLLRSFVGGGQRGGAPFALPPLGRTPLNLIRRALVEMSIPTFVPYEPKARTTPIALVIDGDDYLIAQDFEVELPEFVHDPAVFQRAGRDNADG